jgi:hypothetical protein
VVYALDAVGAIGPVFIKTNPEPFSGMGVVKTQ